MSEPHKRLDQAMHARRLDLGKQWKEIAQEAGISTAALGAIRRGENRPSPLNARRLEDSLQWEYGSIEAILAGGDPTPREAVRSTERATPKREPTLEELQAQIDEVNRTTAELRQQLANLLGKQDEEQQSQDEAS